MAWQEAAETETGTRRHDLSGTDFDINELEDVSFNPAFAPPDPDAVALGGRGR